MRAERMVASHTGKNDGSLKAPWLLSARMSDVTSTKPVLSAQTQIRNEWSLVRSHIAGIAIVNYRNPPNESHRPTTTFEALRWGEPSRSRCFNQNRIQVNKLAQ